MRYSGQKAKFLFPGVGVAGVVCFALSACVTTPPVVPMPSDPSMSPLVGMWKWEKSADGCLEAHTYYPDGTYEISSAEKIVTGRYLVAAQSEINGRVRFDTVAESDNLEPDCGGNITIHIGRMYTRWLMFSDDRNVLVLYDNAQGQSGFGPVLRMGSFELEDDSEEVTPVETQSSPDEVTPTAPLIFNWKEDAQALVTETIEKATGFSQLRYRVRSELNSDNQGRVLRFEDYVLLPGILKQSPETAASYAHMPAFHISADGEFIGVVGALQWLQHAAHAMPSSKLTEQQRMDIALSPESVMLLSQRVSDLWGAWVEAWLGMDTQLEAPVLGSDELDINGVGVRRQYRLERVTDTVTQPDEVVFLLTTELSGPQFVDAIQGQVQQLAASMGGAQPHELTQLRTASQLNVYQITTDVHTLKPKQVKTEQTVHFHPEEGSMQALTEKHTYDFAWQ